MIKRLLSRAAALFLAVILLTAPALSIPESGEERMALLEDIIEWIELYALYPPGELSLDGVTAGLLEGGEELFRSIVDGWLEGDKYGYFMTMDEYIKAFGGGGEIFYGIGIMMDSSMTLGVYVTDILPDGGAAESGMEVGAQIVYVDGVYTADMPRLDARELIIGDWWTQVEIGYINPGSAEVFFERIQRGPITVDNVQCSMIEGTDVGYISISQFGSFVDAFDFYFYYNEYLPEMGAGSVIIDLRGNRGGQFFTSLDMLNYMLSDEGLLLCREVFAGGEEEFLSLGREGFELYDMVVWEPETIVILTDGVTASASEVLAGTLQAYGLAVIVGETTYGKAHSQYHIELVSGDVLIFSIARLELYGIGSYEDIGIVPDFEADYELVYGAELVSFPLDDSRALFRNSILTGRVAAMQERLALLGFYRCPPTGVFDDYTLWCLNRFQAAHDLPQGRFANAETLALLNGLAAEAEFYIDTQFATALELCLGQ